MILTCPACSTRYMTDEGSFAPHGRTVRCAKCGHSWFQRPDKHQARGTGAQFSSGLSGIMNAPKLMRPETVLVDKKGGLGVPGFVLIFLVLCTLVAALYQYRHSIAAAAPVLQGVYRSLGAEVGPTGLDIRNVKIRWADPETKKRLEVWGEIINLGQTAEIIPLLRFSLRDAQGQELFVRTMTLKQRNLTPGAANTFSTVLEGLPEGAVDITVDFASGG